MPYITSIERMGLEKGERLGLEKGHLEEIQKNIATSL